MSLAALRELRRLFPDHHMALLVKPWVAGLFQDQQLVDETIILQNGRSHLRRILDSRARIRRFNTAVLFQNAFESALTVWLAGIPERIGYHTDGRGVLLTTAAMPRIKEQNRHQIYYYLDLLYQTGLSPHDYLSDADFQPDIHLRATEKAIHQAEHLLQQAGVIPERPLVVINPGAHFGPAKRWFSDRYAALADRLVNENKAEVLIIGSPKEIPIAEQIRNHMTHIPKVLAGGTDLQTLVGLLSRCNLFVTNDSGPMHLAAALDIPQIALFGSTDDSATGPFSSKARVFHKHVECSPCLLRECPIDSRCFTSIEVDEVFEAARAVLGCH